MPSLAPCVWPQMAFFMLLLFKDHYHTVYNMHREPYAAMVWLHLQATLASHTFLTLVLMHPHKPSWVQTPHFDQQLQRLHHAKLQLLISYSWSTQQHFICSEPPHVLPKNSSHWICKPFFSFARDYILLPAVWAYLSGMKLGSQKKGKGEKYAVNILF